MPKNTKRLAAIWLASFGIMSAASPATAFDADAAEKAIKRCKGCHQFQTGAKNAFGPVLRAVVGRPAASYDGYRYSNSLTEVSEQGVIWTAEELDKWLSGPTAYLRLKTGNPKARSKMPISINDPSERTLIISYLARLSGASAD